jgi:uncharacterized phage protein (TIGR02218 family)
MPKNLGLLQAGAGQRQFHELWRVTLTDGTVLRFADTNADIQHDVGDGAGLQTWRGGFGVDRTEMRAGMDLQIDTLSVTVRNADLTINGVTRPIGHWAKVRKFHGAEVRVYIYDYRSAASVLDTIWYIQGARVTMTTVEFLLESLLSRLAAAVPRYVFQRECNNAIYDSICGVIKASFEVTSTVQAATTDTVTYGALTPPAPPVLSAYVDGYFDLGQIEFTSGNLLGLKQTIGRHEGSTLYFFYPLPEVPNVGSAITLWPGCHKNIEDCRDKFGNLRGTPADWRQRFRGFPYMPEMEELVG